MKKQHISYLIGFVIFFVLYYITGKYGLDINDRIGYTNLIWMPAGIGLAALLLYGYRMLPVVVAGIAIVSMVRGEPWLSAVFIITADVFEPLLGLYLLRRLRFRNSLEQVSDVVKLAVIVAPVISFLSALIGSFGFISYSPGLPTKQILSWWSGHVVGIMLVAPLLLIWSKHSGIFVKKQRKYIIELSCLFLFVLLYGIALFTNMFGSSGSNRGLPLVYIAYLPILWSIFRFDMRVTISVLALISFFLIASVILQVGPFSFQNFYVSGYSLKSFLTFFSLTTLITGVAVMQNREYEERKDDFIRIASHELKTPLTTVKMVTQLLQRMHSQRKADKEADYLENMNQQVNKMTRMINDMLDLSQIQAGRLKLRKNSFSIDTLIKQSVESMMTVSHKHELIIEKKADVHVLGDKDRIGQVIINLLSNAIKYSPDDERIIVSAIAANKHVIVSVQDFGVGIPQNKITYIFDRFYRAHGERLSEFVGFGLGLYISSEIIKQHEGKIWVESEVGKGSTFYFTLPLA